MRGRKVLVVWLMALLCTAWVKAAEPADSVRQVRTAGALPKTALSLSADLTMHPGGDYRVEQGEEDVEEGSSGLYSKASIRASVPLYQRGRSFLSSSLRYSHIHQHFTPDSRLLDYGFGETTHHIFSANLMGMTRLKLGRKSLMLMGMALGECSQYGFERWMAMGTAMVMLKETRRTQFGIGLLGMVNTFSKIPVFPFFTYRHTWNERWMLNLVLPTLQVRYTHSRSDAFALGMSIDADHFFIHPQTEGLPDRVRYSRCVQNFGPTYEHRFPHGLTFTADAGISLIMTNRINKSGGSQKLADMHEKAAPYCRIAFLQRLGF